MIVLAAWVAATYLRLSSHVSLHDSFVIGLALVFAWVCTLPGRPRLPRPSPGFAVAAIVLLGVGVLMRVLELGVFPPAHGQLWEEAQMGKIADASIHHDALDHYFPLPNLLAELGLRLGGYSLTALRVPFVVASATAVGAFLLTARTIGTGAFASLAATALFATCAYLSAVGRVALESYSPILTLCLALASSFHAARARTPFAYALAGMLGGLLMTEYTSYRLYPPLLLAMLAVAAHLAAGIGAALTLTVLYVGCAVAVMLPVLVVPNESALHMLAEGVLRHRNDMAAAHLGWTESALAIAARIGQSASFVFLRGSANDLLPGSLGVVDHFTGVAGIVALVYCAVLAWRSPRSARSMAAAFLVVAAIATVVLSGALTRSPARYRITPLPPLLFLAIALAIDAAHRRWPSRFVTAIMATAIAAICAFNIHLLFAEAMGDPQVQAEFGDRRIAVALEIANLQERFDGTVLLGTAETFMTVPNDFSFLYDLSRVSEYNSDARIAATPRSVLLIDADRRDEIRGLPWFSECTTDEFVYGPRRIAFAACPIVGR